MKYLKYCLPALLCAAMKGLAQSPPQPMAALAIGDEVPAITITNLYNYPVSTIQLSRFKGKLVILDFWSTWCGSCIEAFPKMQHLQKKYGDQLQVILVNTYMGDDIKKVKPFFEKQKARTGEAISLPYSLLQASLAQYFPHRFVPHYVWIDQQGKMIATTSQAEVSTENISAVLEGKQIALHTKKDMLDFDPHQPLFVDGNGGNGNDCIYRSIFTNYIEGLGTTSGLERDANDKITRFYMLNNSLWLLLKAAYPVQLRYPASRIILETKHPALFVPGAMADSLVYQNSFCYELRVPPCTAGELFGYMREDIARVFRLKVCNEERQIKCLVLQKSTLLGKLLTKGGTATVSIDQTSSKKMISNQPLSVFVKILNGLEASKATPVIDETGMLQNIDIAFPPGFPDLDSRALKAFLQASGFQLLEAERRIGVAVIEDGGR